MVSKTSHSKNFHLREIIERGLEDLEDYFLAVDLLNRFRSGTEKVRTASELSKALGVND